MEILNSYQSITDGYAFFSCLFMIISILFSVIFAVCADTWKGRVIALLIPIVTFVIILLPIRYFSEDIYKVKVNDWNEVYNNGFEIIKIEGELVTLKKIKE